MIDLTVLCPLCDAPLTQTAANSDAPSWKCDACGHTVAADSGSIDLTVDQPTTTAAHYSVQWGEDMGFLDYIRQNPQAKKIMASAQLGWDRLFASIKDKATREPVYVYDAACGYGGIPNELVTDATVQHLRYVGADIHDALAVIPERLPLFRQCGLLLRHDISRPLPVAERFDFVLCRNALHHTPEPATTFASLAKRLKPDGVLAISVYRKKAICRETLDDTFRTLMMPMPAPAAFANSRQFTLLGQALQEVHQTVTIPEDLPVLGIAKGTYKVQELIYNHFLKCFYNQELGEQYSTLVNFDWYHPPFAYRYDLDEVKEMFRANGLDVRESMTSTAQHYVVGVAAAA
jgi:SAM-dependent methyltransferase